MTRARRMQPCILLFLLVVGAGLGPLAQAQEPKSVRNYLVFGDDERTAVTDTTQKPWSSMGMVIARWGESGGNQIRSGTGTLISDHVVVTAAHVVYEPGVGWAESITFVPGRNGVLAPYGAFKGVEAVALDQWTTSQDNDFDLALILLSAAAGKVTGTMRVVGQPPSFYVNRTLNLSGYPTDLNWNQLYNGQGQSDSVDGNLIHHHIDGGQGESGGPIWITDPETGEAELVGIYDGDVHVTQGGQVLDTYGYGIAINATFCSWMSNYVSAHDPDATGLVCSAAEDAPTQGTLPACGAGLAGLAPMAAMALGLVRRRARWPL
jgi:V8-like Glu-specific endopeptidase